MKRLFWFILAVGILLVMFAALWASFAIASDWRWASPKLKKQTVTYSCSDLACIKQTYTRERKRYERRVLRHDKARLREWKHWTGLYLPDCTWYGESGFGAEYSPLRYTMSNSMGSGAYGKFQFMPGTYHSVAKYHDWSALDQEISARREYWLKGSTPWANC